MHRRRRQVWNSRLTGSGWLKALKLRRDAGDSVEEVSRFLGHSSLAGGDLPCGLVSGAGRRSVLGRDMPLFGLQLASSLRRDVHVAVVAEGALGVGRDDRPFLIAEFEKQRSARWVDVTTAVRYVIRCRRERADPVAWRGPVEAGRLVVVSPFEEKERRVTAELAERRNLVVVALAERVFISYAEAGGKMEALAQQVVGWGKPVFTFAAEENEALLRVGARAVAGGGELLTAWGSGRGPDHG